MVQELALHGIAQLILREGLLEKQQILEYQRKAVDNRQSLQRYLVNQDILPALILARLTAQHFNLPMLNLDDYEATTIPTRLLSEQLIRQHRVLPLYIRENYLFLATDDPGNHSSLREIRFYTGLPIKALVVETDKLHQSIEKILTAGENQRLSDNVEMIFDKLSEDLPSHNTADDDAPVIKFLNKFLLEAVQSDVSDIHFEPYENEFRIRYRRDGLLLLAASPPCGIANRITTRIKVMANLDISEKRIPQDGRFKWNAVDVRVNTCPTVNGEKTVLRILHSDVSKYNINALGLSEPQKNHFLQALNKPQGMILVTGPTGSGKTATLYSALNFLNTLEKNISTAEDPVEIKLSGINQASIHPKSGLTFPAVLRAFLRQDPDIIMLGEIRDAESADIAIKAAQTGHLLLSTLHTNSAAESLTRLQNMGISSFNIAGSVSLIIAQRLVRKLCLLCRRIHSELSLDQSWHPIETADVILYAPVGCQHCNKGYSGRTALFELMPISATINAMIREGANALDIKTQAEKDGMLSLHQSGMEKIRQGITSLEEIMRVTVD